MNCIILHSHQQCMRVSVAPHPHKHLMFSVLQTLVVLDSMLKSRHYFANIGPSSQSYGFSSSHVWM